jgi:hypothetical protein
MSGARAAGSPARVQYVGHPSTDPNRLQTAPALCFFFDFLFSFSFVTNGGG